jgi:hypothetical protein
MKAGDKRPVALKKNVRKTPKTDDKRIKKRILGAR